MDQRQMQWLEECTAAARAVKRDNNKISTLKRFSIPSVRLLSLFSCSSPSNMTDFFILNLTWKIIAAVVIHVPICPAYSSEPHSSAATPPPQRMNQRVHKNQPETLSRAMGNICAHFIMEHTHGW